MKGYSYNITNNSCCFRFVNDSDERHEIWTRKEHWAHYGIQNRLINYLRTRGWTIEKDVSVPLIIRPGRWYGRKGDLEFKTERYPRGFKFEFFQNVVFENPHGGYYDFDKYEKMPYLVRLMYLNETRHMAEFLRSIVREIVCSAEPCYKVAENWIKYDFVTSWHHPQACMDDFSLSDLDGQTFESYNSSDRDKRTLYNGQVKYFRDFGGHLARGRVYHNINNMWWVIVNTYEYRNKADFELFDPTPEDFSWRRLAINRAPKDYKVKRKELSEAKTKELLAELKRRGVHVRKCG